MAAYVVERLDQVSLDKGSPADGKDQMSPFVWRDGERYAMLMRAVPNPLTPTEPTGIIVAGSSPDGLTFTMQAKAAIAPDTDPASPDAGGCEDPTVLPTADGRYLVYYTGVDGARTQGCLMLAEGPALHDLTKRQVSIQAPPGEGNIKEATLARTAAGDWRIFYEYAAHDASRIGMARGPAPDGPWTVVADPFTIREDGWDNWHLSTGPILCEEGADPVMFYNGATHDARWRIGWISFNADFSRITGRGVEPLLMPPPAPQRAAVDIAFAASCIAEDGLIRLYYSLGDRALARADVRRYD